MEKQETIKMIRVEPTLHKRVKELRPKEYQFKGFVAVLLELGLKEWTKTHNTGQA